MDASTENLNPLKSTVVQVPANAVSKGLARALSPLDSKFTKIRGRGLGYVPVDSGHLVRL
jgi:hypothetical protein